MITFIARFLKGLILGWIASLMMFLLKRMLSKAFGVNIPNPQQKQRRHHSSTNTYYTRQTANQNAGDVVETMWVGMSLAQLQNAFGQPVSKRNVTGGEIWTYNSLNGQGVQTEITIQNGAVASWQDVRSRPSEPFAAPAP